MEVQIISKKLIKPSVPTPCHLQKYMSISFMDQLLPPLFMPMIFYYPNNGSRYDPIKNVERRRKLLEKSLSEILILFYPLAGRYIKENLLVHCNDEGVEYAEALVNGDISRILRGESDTKELDRFLPGQVEESNTSPLMAIQINIFNCGGLAIGLRHSHRIMDGFSFSMFMNGWAKACKLERINDDIAIPSFEAGVLFPSRDLPRFQLLHLSKPRSELVTKVFFFDEETISKLKTEGKPSTTTEVLTALIWRAQIEAARARFGRTRTSLLLVLMNLRGTKTFKKILENCCGNIYTRITARYHQAEIMELKSFVDRVRNAIRNSMAEYAEPISEDGLFSKVMKPCIEMVEEGRKGEADVHMFSSVINLGFRVDFGWGKPGWVSMAKMPFKSVFFIARNGGGGVGGGTEAWVTMDKDDMAFFEKDPNIVMAMKSDRKMETGIHFLRPKI